MQVNGKQYQVYPDLMSILKQSRRISFHKSTPINRKIILENFYASLLASFKNVALTDKLTNQEVH